MDYEKEYKNLVAKVKKAHQFAQTDSTKSVLEDILPQLRESEDEMHRKWILEYLYDGLRKADEQFKDHFKSAIDWLERKKIPSISLNPALGFDPGSAVVYHNDESKDERIRKSLINFLSSFELMRDDATFRKGDFDLDAIKGYISYLEKQKEQMMKGAVEGYVTLTLTGVRTVAATIKEEDNIGPGDKVRIIIIKEDEK